MNKITALINKNWVNVIKKLGDLHVCLKTGRHQIKPSEFGRSEWRSNVSELTHRICNILHCLCNGSVDKILF